MNLIHLRYFVELAHSGSYARTAQKLNTTQPNITYAVTQIETELGIALFVKNGRSNQLTAYGRQFLSYAEGTLRTLDSGINAIHKSIYEHTVIRLGFLRFLGMEYIPNLVMEFQKAHPEYKVEFEFETGSTASLFDGLSANRLDLVFCAPSRPLHGYHAVVSRQKFYVITPLEHPLCRKEKVRLEDTLEYPYVYYAKGSGMRHVTDRYFKEISAVPDIRYEILEEHVVTGFVAAGFGIAIVPEMLILDSMPVKRIEIENIHMGRDIHMVLTDSQDVSPVLREFYRFAVSHPDKSREY